MKVVDVTTGDGSHFIVSSRQRAGCPFQRAALLGAYRSKQEKPFHELILQIRNCDDTAAGTEIADKATEALREYISGFQERNPHLRVFSAHLHLDEHTPHIHIDFVPCMRHPQMRVFYVTY